MVIVFRSNGVQECLERSLVLAAVDIDHVLRRDWWGWCLLTEEASTAAAKSQIALYEQENQATPAPLQDPPSQVGMRLGLTAYAMVLLGVFYLQGSYGFGLDWTASGRVDVAAIQSGEFWRVFTALTLHRDLWHLLGNLGFGAIFAVLLTRQLGSGVTWLFIVLAGGCGNGLNVLIQQPGHLSIGASTAVFAALGLLTAFYFFFSALNRDTWARRWVPVVGGLWVLAWLGTGDAGTDIVAHLTGFLAGFFLGGLLGRVPKPTKHDSSAQLITGLMALGIITGSWALAVP